MYKKSWRKRYSDDLISFFAKQIFQVEERGEALIAQITVDVEDIRKKLPQVEDDLRILVFDSGE